MEMKTLIPVKTLSMKTLSVKTLIPVKTLTSSLPAVEMKTLTSMKTLTPSKTLILKLYPQLKL